MDTPRRPNRPNRVRLARGVGAVHGRVGGRRGHLGVLGAGAPGVFFSPPARQLAKVQTWLTTSSPNAPFGSECFFFPRIGPRKGQTRPFACSGGCERGVACQIGGVQPT